jgi:hypothetical protein
MFQDTVFPVLLQATVHVKEKKGLESSRSSKGVLAQLATQVQGGSL